MWETASEDQIQEVTNHLIKMGFAVHRTTGARQSVLAAVGKRIDFDIRELEVLPGVQTVHRISAPYKLVGRTFRPEGTVVKLPNGVEIGGKRSCCDGWAMFRRIAGADLCRGGDSLRGRRQSPARRRVQAPQLAIHVSGLGRRGAQADARGRRRPRAAGHQRGDGDFADRADDAATSTSSR